MATVKKFEDLECWQDARGLVNLVYKMVRRSPFSKDRELGGQVVRSSLSIMANIADGFHRKSHPDFIRFLDYCRSSSAETLSHLYVARDQNYINDQELEAVKAYIDVIWKKINRLITYLRSREPRSAR